MSDLIAGQYCQLTAHVGRLIAPNAGFMTGPGTNAYLIGDAMGIAVIDPGPDDEKHIDRLCAAAPGPIESILVTHTHRDHSPAAIPLSELTGARLYGMAAPPTPENDTTFRADVCLSDGDTVTIGDVIIEAIHTPGHASNHLCYLIRTDGLLFTGDHIMDGSTVVIAPPDGDMAAYLRSLRKIRELGLRTIGPGHGNMLDNPESIIDWTIAHRYEREKKVLSALRARSAASIDTLLPDVYGDVDTRVHRIAKYSLRAHLEKLLADGAVSVYDDLWRVANSNTGKEER